MSTHILGISAFFHDSAAALLRGRHLLERLWESGEAPWKVWK